MKSLLLKYSATLCFLGVLFEGASQLIVPFSQRTSPSNPGVTIYNLKGDFTMIGNTNLTLQNYGDNTSNNNPMIFVDIDNDAANELAKINQKILPHRAICIRGAQCISGKCLESNNEGTYGYCAEPLPPPTA